MDNSTKHRSNRLAIITGAGGALGGAVASSFARAGWDLALFEFGAQGTERLRNKYPDAVVVDVDLTDEAATTTAVHEVLMAKDRVDALLGIAGGFALSKAHEASIGELDRMMRLNLTTLFNSVGAVLPAMRERGHGHIIGVSAGAALTPSPGMAPYAASKSAVAAYLDSIRAELGTSGIRVTTLYPMDALDTPANRRAMPNTDPAGWISTTALADLLLSLTQSSPRAHVAELRVYADHRRGG